VENVGALGESGTRSASPLKPCAHQARRHRSQVSDTRSAPSLPQSDTRRGFTKKVMQQLATRPELAVELSSPSAVVGRTGGDNSAG
jgi:hypothetical protein